MDGTEYGEEKQKKQTKEKLIKGRQQDIKK